MAVDEVCLACTHHPYPVCDGSGVRLVRDHRDQVVDVEVCPRWPASWEEPLAYYAARAEHRVDALPATTMPEKIWPAVQAEIARTKQTPAGDRDGGLWVVGVFFAVLSAAFVVAVIRMVLS